MKDRKTLTKVWQQLGLAFLNGLLVIFISESLLRESIAKAWMWMFINPVGFIVNIMLVALTYLVLVAVVNRAKPAMVMLYVFSTLFTAVNYFKFKYLGQYFYPWDFDSGRELIGIADVVFQSGSRKIALIGLILILVVLIGLGIRAIILRLKSEKKEGFNRWFRVAMVCLALLTMHSIGFKNEGRFEKPLRKIGIINYGWNQSTNYDQNGSLLSFLLSISSTQIAKPDGYSEKMVAQACKSIGTEPQALEAQAVKPNVIIVMNESFWDPTVLSEVPFNVDPLESIRDQDIDTFVSPTFGGVTCNVEFEFLTGMNTRFLPQGVIPYQQYLKRKVSALPWEFKQNGYHTLSIHPYQEWFWNRKQVYPLLGFEESLWGDTVKHKEKKGFYISDDSVVDEITDAVKKNEKPVFIFAVTMQNHGPYGDKRYKKDNTIKVDVEDKDNKQMIETYSQGAEDAAEAYMKLIDQVAKSDEPTIVIQFGDHLPGLGDGYKVYRDYNFIGSESSTYGAMKLDERIKMKKTPLLHFANYKTFDLPNAVGPSMLSSYVIKEAGITPSNYFMVVGALAEKYPVIASEFLMNEKGDVIQEKNNSYVKQYGILQYDQLFGKNYLANVKPENLLSWDQ